MPTYVYECASCSKVFEIEQRITESALKDCQCGSKDTLKRLIQPVGISFKGAGFYVNDTASRVSEPDCTGEPTTCACSNPEANEKSPA